MYGKMQESGLTEIIPFICISAIWGQHPVFFDIWSFLTIGSGCNLMAATSQVFFLSAFRAHQLIFSQFSSVQSLSRIWLCNPVDCSMPGLPVHRQLPEFTQTHVHWVCDASSHILLCHPLLLPPSVLEGCAVITDDCDILVYWYGRK